MIEKKFSDELVTFKDLHNVIGGRSRITIWRWERKGIFPKRVNINNRSYWKKSEIDDWLSKQGSTNVA